MGKNKLLTNEKKSNKKKEDNSLNTESVKVKLLTKNPLKITDTTLRDAHQSLLATRMTTKEMIPACEKLDEVGFYSMEVWGGATFDSCLRYLDEDPWDRLRILRKHLPKTKLQMLLRGQNILGYKHYSDDVVVEFVKRAVANGIDIIRIFDALNDTRNMETAFKVAKSEGTHVQGTICFTISPFHDNELFVKKALEMEQMGADSICIKDMAGLISPYEAYNLTKDMKKVISIPLQLHCHFTSGMGMMAYLKAAEAGIDVVDTAISSLALQTSQPAIEPLVETLRGTPRDTGLDLGLAYEIATYFKKVRENHKEMESNVQGIDTRVLTYQIPGGMLSNLAVQLKQQKAEDKYEEVLKEIPRVRKELGYPPLVTPTSQIVGTQTTLNVILKERYKIIPAEVQKYLKGFYGRSPAPIDSKVIKKAKIKKSEIIKCRPADLLEPTIKKVKKEKPYFIENIEDTLSYILFPEVAKEFLKSKFAKKNHLGMEILNGKNSYDEEGYGA
ncbi:MAG: pyruvate carboxylase subunit B [Candidatus Caldatribacteriota bacterium]|nr:pyruvate carboxylase subunit B [Candidatus Caldatribacteriota bacterium]